MLKVTDGFITSHKRLTVKRVLVGEAHEGCFIPNSLNED